MKIKGNYAIYNYGIKEFKEYEQNPNLLIMVYGMDKTFYFHKKDSYKLFKALYGQGLMDALGIDQTKFDDNVTKYGLLQVLNNNLKGRAVVFVTNFKDYFEYLNGGQNLVKGITSIDIDGELFAKNSQELFPDTVTYDEKYNYKKEDLDDSEKE